MIRGAIIVNDEKKKNNEKENAQYVKGRTLNSDLCQTSSSHNNANKTLGYIS